MKEKGHNRYTHKKLEEEASLILAAFGRERLLLPGVYPLLQLRLRAKDMNTQE